MKRFFDDIEVDNPFSLIADVDSNGDAVADKLDWDKIFPVLPLRNMVLSPA